MLRWLLRILMLLVAAPLPAAALPDDGQGWQIVDRPRPFVFPADHAAHPDYRIEWWYYTGHLATPGGRHFGYQLTFFRTGIVRQPTNPSAWSVRDLYIAHLALSDLDQRKFRFFQRARRQGVGWAGADAQRYHVWNGDWSARLDGETQRLIAADEGLSLALELQPQKPPVPHGDAGLSRKGPSPGNASYYYSFTRLQTSGRLTVDGQACDVTGVSWMDHEFSSSFLEAGQQGWDWLSLQLDDGRDLMVYQVRHADGSADPLSSATLVDAAGRARHLERSQFVLEPRRRWQSPDTGGNYPIEWTLRLPQEQAEFSIAAAYPQQEMNTVASNGFPYWEGSVTIRGRWGNTPITGRGYLEMTGYAKGLNPAPRQ